MRIANRLFGFEGLRLPGAKAISAGVILLLGACGSGSGSPGTTAPSALPAPSPAPTAPPASAVITITSRGVSPAEVAVALGGTVTFVNNDAQPHDLAGGVDPQHPDCAEIDAVGFLSPGQQRATRPFLVVRTCAFHDHSFHAETMNGRVIIQ